MKKRRRRWKWKIWIGNQIGYEGAKSLSESLKINTSLTTLDLGSDEKIRNEKERRNENEKNEQVIKWELKELKQ